MKLNNIPETDRARLEQIINVVTEAAVRSYQAHGNASMDDALIAAFQMELEILLDMRYVCNSDDPAVRTEYLIREVARNITHSIGVALDLGPEACSSCVDVALRGTGPERLAHRAQPKPGASA